MAGNHPKPSSLTQSWYPFSHEACLTRLHQHFRKHPISSSPNPNPITRNIQIVTTSLPQHATPALTYTTVQWLSEWCFSTIYPSINLFQNLDQFLEGIIHVNCLIADTFHAWPAINKQALPCLHAFPSGLNQLDLVLNIYYHLDLLIKHGHFGSNGM